MYCYKTIFLFSEGFAESGFCADEDDTVDCALLPSFPGVGEVENCSTTRCSSDECNQFLSE